MQQTEDESRTAATRLLPVPGEHVPAARGPGDRWEEASSCSGLTGDSGLWPVPHSEV